MNWLCLLGVGELVDKLAVYLLGVGELVDELALLL